MKVRLDSLPGGQGMTIVLGALVVVALLIVLVTARSMGVRIDQVRDETGRQQETLAWMQRAAGEVKALQEAADDRKSGDGGRHVDSPLALIGATAAEHGLEQALKRVAPTDDQGVRVWLEAAAFRDLMVWLDVLWKQYGLAPTEFTAERTALPGVVNARLALAYAGKGKVDGRE